MVLWLWQGIVDSAIKKVEAQGHSISTVLVYDHALAAKRADVAFVEGRDVWWQDAVPRQPTECPVEWMGAEEPLFKVGIASLTSLPASCRGHQDALAWQLPPWRLHQSLHLP